jgi:hypothetical protein
MALKLLGLSKLETLDKERKATRKRWAETPGSTEVPPVSDDDQPWPEPVTDIGPVLDIALTELARYVIAPLHRLATAVLWSAYAHLLPRADLGIDVAPRLGIRSKVRGSGKSTLLECVENLTPNPVLAGSITSSSTFRIIAATRATLLIDEADNIVNKNSSPDLLAILNSGHRRRTAYVIRSVPTPDGGWAPAKFNTFTGIAFAGLEILPETLQDRSLGLPLHKATREEKPEHLANGYSPILIECRRRFARWAADLQELSGATLPPELFNRTGDNWHGLFGIAEAAGGEWPERAKRAAMEEISEEDSNHALQLLEAIWQIFAEKKVVRMHTKVLLDALKRIEEAPWEEANNGREINAYWLREKLKGFLPRPANPEEAAALRCSRQWREGNANPLKGYTSAHAKRQAASDADAVADALACSGSPGDVAKSSATSQLTDEEGDFGLEADVANKNGVKDPPPGRGSQQGGARPGPARRRTRPNGPRPSP